jgi:hypothetical protein
MREGPNGTAMHGLARLQIRVSHASGKSTDRRASLVSQSPVGCGTDKVDCHLRIYYLIRRYLDGKLGIKLRF